MHVAFHCLLSSRVENRLHCADENATVLASDCACTMMHNWNIASCMAFTDGGSAKLENSEQPRAKPCTQQFLLIIWCLLQYKAVIDITVNCCEKFHKKTAACWCVWQRRASTANCQTVPQKEIYCWYSIIIGMVIIWQAGHKAGKLVIIWQAGHHNLASWLWSDKLVMIWQAGHKLVIIWKAGHNLVIIWQLLVVLVQSC